jgi:prephenate dehydrogenase
MVDTLARMSDEDEIFRYAAGGFRDFTRIASSDPVMWRDICLANDRAVLLMLERYQQDLSRLAEAIRAGDGVELERVFRNAKAARDRHSER